MTSFDFSMTPIHAAAFHQVGRLSAAHACRLAMTWLEAGSDSHAVAAIAIENPSTVSWSDISATFDEALLDSGVRTLTSEEVKAVLMHGFLLAVQKQQRGPGEIWAVGTLMLGLGDSLGFSLPRVPTERLYVLSLEFEEASIGNDLTGRTLSEIAEDLRQEADRVLSEIEQAWPVCVNG